MTTFNNGESGLSIRTKINEVIDKVDGTTPIPSIDIDGGTIDGVTIGGTTPGAVTTSSLVATTADINGGTIDGTVIGGTSPAAGTFASALVDTTIRVGGGSNLQIRDAAGSLTTAEILASVTSGVSAVGAGVNDGVNNRRAALVMDDTNNLWGLTSNYSTGTPPQFVIRDGLGERMRIDSTGNVGVGTSSPVGNMHLATSVGNTVLQMTGATGSTASNGLSLIVGAGGDASIYQREANYLRFGTSNTERMRINSVGNVGIGTTAPATKLQVSPSPSSGDQGPVAITLGNESNSARGAQITKNTSTPYNFTLTAGLNATVGSATVFETRPGAEAMRIDSSGNVGIGTSSPLGKLDVTGGNLFVKHSTAPDITLRQTSSTIVSGTSLGRLLYQGTNAAGTYPFASVEAEVDGSTGANDAPGRLLFKTTPDGSNVLTERMRIDASGNLLVGTTTAGPSNSISTSIEASGLNNSRIYVNHSSAGSSNGSLFMGFGYAGNTIGSITQGTTSSVSYNITSDYRLKENVTPLAGAADRLAQIPVHRFNFIADPNTTVDGFLAHEVQAVVPEAVTGAKDAVDADGKPVYQGIDQSKLVPLLTAALQEALKRIEALENQLRGN